MPWLLIYRFMVLPIQGRRLIGHAITPGIWRETALASSSPLSAGRPAGNRPRPWWW